MSVELITTVLLHRSEWKFAHRASTMRRLCDSGLMLSCALRRVLTAIHICLCSIKWCDVFFMMHKQMWIAVSTLPRAQERIRPESHSRHIVLTRCVNFHSDRFRNQCAMSSYIFQDLLACLAWCLVSGSYETDLRVSHEMSWSISKWMSNSLQLGYGTHLNENWHTAPARCARCVTRVWCFLVP